MLPFPGVERVLPFMKSRLTLGSLHKGQTSQDQFAGAGAALEVLTDICQSSQLVSGKARDEKWLNFLTFLPQIRKEKGSPWSVAHGTPAAWLISGGTKCQLPIRGGSGHPINLINSKNSRTCARGRSPFRSTTQVGDPPPPPQSVRFFSGAVHAENWLLSFKKWKCLKSPKKSWIKAYFPFPKVTFCCKGQNGTKWRQ